MTETPASIEDVIERFADGEPVPPDALVNALATVEGREQLREILSLRALFREAPVVSAAARSAPRVSLRLLPAIAAAALLVAGGGYVGFSVAARRPPADNARRAEPITTAPPATTVIKLDANAGWRDRSGGF